MRQDNITTNDHKAENDFLEQHPDLQVPDHLSQRPKRNLRRGDKCFWFDQRIPLFQPPGHTHLEDWFLIKVINVQESAYQDSYWFLICPSDSNKTCSYHHLIPQTF
jgi:hypothetical protein